MKRILIAPLDWGLGHATRCIPIIRYLLEKNVEMVIGADGRPFELLKREFPSCEFVKMPGYNISYPKSGSMALKIAAQIPKILSGIKREHEQLKAMVKERKIDAVISDNRFGLWSADVPCVFITHQVMIKSLVGERWIHGLNKKYISKYTECWVPDSKENGLSGDLAHKFLLPGNAKFIGVLSRFTARHPSSMGECKRNILIILSGPEPQRTVLEKKILEQIHNIPRPDKVGTPPSSPSRSAMAEQGKGELTALIVQGITEKNDRRKLSENVEIVSHLTSEELEREIIVSQLVLSRPGYSTVMDLAMLGRKAIFVPTPGQTEQEYLGKYLMEKKMAYSVSQKEFDLKTAWKESRKYTGFTGNYSGEEFKGAIDMFLAETQSAQRNAN